MLMWAPIYLPQIGSRVYYRSDEETTRDGNRPRRLRELQTPDGRITRRAEGQGVENETSKAKTSEAETSGLISRAASRKEPPCPVN